jgi:Zn-dependent protease with chaperone function
VFTGIYSMQTAPAASTASFGAWVAHNGGTLAVIAVITLAAIGLASFYRAATLAAGGGQVARMMGGTLLDPHSTDPLHRQLLNVTEEMAIASGVPVPEIYILEQEAGINAFAAGLATSNAAIAVTRGALEQLDRAELQGVVAHEFSHILNGDMRINQKLIGMSFGIVVLTLMGRWMLRAAYLGRRGRSGGAAAAAVAMGLALIVIGSIGIFFSRLIKAAVSRQREMLADASAVQFTRDPNSLAGALKKIGGYSSKLTAVDSEEIAHMLFARSSRAFSGLFATHPPLPARIRALDPSFREGDFPKPRQAPDRAALGAADASATSAAAPVSALAATGTASAAGRQAANVDPDRGADTLMDHAGEVGSTEGGCALRTALPAILYDAAHERDDSLLLVLALALAADEPARTRQLTMLDNRLGAQRTERCAALRETLDAMDPALRLPLLELTVPALRQRPVEQIGFMFDMVTRISDAADTNRLDDYVLLKALAAYLPTFKVPEKRRSPSLSTTEAVARTLAAVAAFGHDDIAAARAAFAAGLTAGSSMDVATTTAKSEQYLPDLQAARDLSLLDDALDQLADAAPKQRRAALVAILATIRHDHRVEIPEVELFRAIAATLDCPLPPLAALSV